MSLTTGNSPFRAATRFAGLAIAAAGGIVAAWAQGLTDSDIQSLAGRGDTLWLLTPKGINLTIDTTDTTPQWWSSKSDGPWALAFSGGQAFASLGVKNSRSGSASVTVTNTLFWFDHPRGTTTPASVTATVLDPGAREPNIVCYGAARLGTTWWLAMNEGGLVPLGVSGATRSYTPGRALGTPLGALTIDSTSVAQSSVVSVTVYDSASLLVATPQRLWTYAPADSMWDSLTNEFADPGVALIENIAAYVDTMRSPTQTYAVKLVRVGADSIVCLFKLAGTQWRCFHGRDGVRAGVRGVSFARGGYVYVADSIGISLYIDSSATPVPAVQRGPLNDRILFASDLDADNVRQVNDILATQVSDTTVRLWIATTEGLYYSREERPGVADTTPFRFTRRTIDVKGDLAQVYARPGILNNREASGRTEFVYSLAKPARVTIEIFDWNMDHVKTVVKNDGPRKAGGSGSSAAPSTDPNRDWWDGTNAAGRTVAPGVYYFKLTTDEGGRAYGKIVVALQRP